MLEQDCIYIGARGVGTRLGPRVPVSKHAVMYVVSCPDYFSPAGTKNAVWGRETLCITIDNIIQTVYGLETPKYYCVTVSIVYVYLQPKMRRDGWGYDMIMKRYV